MLNRVWRWAGKQRTSNKNLGLFKENIATELLANQSQHVLTPLEARPPDRVVPGGIALQTKCGIVRDQRAHGFDAAAAKHRTVGSVEGAGGDRTRQRRDSVFALDGRVCSV